MALQIVRGPESRKASTRDDHVTVHIARQRRTGCKRTRNPLEPQAPGAIVVLCRRHDTTMRPMQVAVSSTRSTTSPLADRQDTAAHLEPVEHEKNSWLLPGDLRRTSSGERQALLPRTEGCVPCSSAMMICHQTACQMGNVPAACTSSGRLRDY